MNEVKGPRTLYFTMLSLMVELYSHSCNQEKEETLVNMGFSLSEIEEIIGYDEVSI